jgi:uncharacterized protein DUF5670
MLLLFALVLIVGWALGYGVFHVASVAIHFLIILAVISLLLHVIRRRRVT